MPYTTLQPPFTLNLGEMSNREIKDYSRWFFESLPLRKAQLTEAVAQTPGFESWQPNESPSSLNMLGDWFATQIETRPRTHEERQAITSRAAFPIEINNEELTNRTLSIAMDVGIYFAQVLQKNYPALRWEQPLSDKKFADYGHPVLVGFGLVPLNPLRITTTLAYGLASKKQTGKRLRELYDYWSKQIQPKS